MRLAWLILLFGLLAAPARAQTARLTVSVQNIQAVKGKLQVALFSAAAGFPDKAKPAQAKVVPVTGNPMQVTFDVAPGTYALAVYQDENSNGKMDKKMFGIPTEPYGFSNNVRPKVSAPTFAECQVAVPAAGQQVSIRIQ